MTLLENSNIDNYGQRTFQRKNDHISQRNEQIIRNLYGKNEKRNGKLKGHLLYTVIVKMTAAQVCQKPKNEEGNSKKIFEKQKTHKQKGS